MALLVGRDVRRDKVDAAKVEALASSMRQREMAAMDGIESAAEKSDVHRFTIQFLRPTRPSAMASRDSIVQKSTIMQ